MLSEDRLSLWQLDGEFSTKLKWSREAGHGREEGEVTSHYDQQRYSVSYWPSTELLLNNRLQLLFDCLFEEVSFSSPF